MTQTYDYLMFDKDVPNELKDSLVSCKINYNIIRKKAYVLTLDKPLDLPQLIEHDFYKIIHTQEQFAFLAQKSLQHLCSAPYSEQMFYDLQDSSITEQVVETIMTELTELYSSMMLIVPHSDFSGFIEKVIEIFTEVQTHRQSIGFDKKFEICVSTELYDDSDDDMLELVEPTTNNSFIVASQNIQ